MPNRVRSAQTKDISALTRDQDRQLMDLLDYFDQLYVINLPSRTDRQKEMAEELSRIGLGFDHPQIKLFEAVRPSTAGAFPSIGAHGCFMSHLSVLSDAQEKGFARILIAEDDLNFTRDFSSRIDSLLQGLSETDWAIFYGGYRISSEVALNPAGGLALIPPQAGIQTTHFVCLQGPAISTAKDYLTAMLSREPGDPKGGPMHVDGAYTWFRRDHPDLVTIGACPELGYQRPSQSDIFLLGWKDKMPLINTCVKLLRKLKNVLLRK